MAAVLLTGFQATSWIDPNPAAELIQMIDAEQWSQFWMSVEQLWVGFSPILDPLDVIAHPGDY